jgi:hypothetical protein
MNVNTKLDIYEARVYLSNSRCSEDKQNKGRQSNLKCNYYNNFDHFADHCWALHPYLKPKFARDTKAY